MSPEAVVGTIFAATLIYLNLVATYHILRIGYLPTFQRVVQLVIVWLVPLFGATVFICFHFSDKDYIRDEKLRSGFGRSLLSLVIFAGFVGTTGTVPGEQDGGADYGAFGSGDGGGGDA